VIDVKNTGVPVRRRGRPPAFDRSDVVKKAAETFWRLGYEGASIVDLTTAMGITPQSLYAAFTSKAALYEEVLGWYQANIGASTTRALEEGSAIDALAHVLRESAREFTRPGRPKGCMISTAVLTCAVENAPIAHHVAGLRGRTLDMLAARIRKGIEDGQLKPETEPEPLARFVGAMIQGMSVQALDGASRPALLAMAALAIAELDRHRA
jgi:AcrR family transcriptional regulator